jgi:hypothetical protein
MLMDTYSLSFEPATSKHTGSRANDDLKLSRRQFRRICALKCAVNIVGVAPGWARSLNQAR